MTIRRTRLNIRNEYHEAGEQLFVERHALRQALAWRVAAELARRHPGNILITEMHPAGGTYDVVAINARTHGDDAAWPGGWRTVVMMNKRAPGDHLTHNGWFAPDGGPERFNWLEVLLCPDLRTQIVEPLELAEGLPSPKRTPATTSASIGVRLLAVFAERAAFTNKPWILLNGYRDTSDGSGGPRDAFFEAFPGLPEDRRERRDDDIFGVPDFRYWFIVEGHLDDHGEPKLCIDTLHGRAFTATGPVALMAAYEDAGRRLDGMANAVLPPAY